MKASRWRSISLRRSDIRCWVALRRACLDSELPIVRCHGIDERVDWFIGLVWRLKSRYLRKRWDNCSQKFRSPPDN